MGPDFVEHFEVGRFHGVGPATEAKMRALDISTGTDPRYTMLCLPRTVACV
jgi:DNA polymerase-4